MHDPSFVPAYIRATHLVNIIVLSLLMRSGLQILSAFPRLYFGDNTGPGKEWIRFTNRYVPREDPDQIYKGIVTEEVLPRPALPPLPRRLTPFRLALWIPRALGALVWALTRTVVITQAPQEVLQERIHTSLDEELDAPPWLALPGHKNLGLGRHWHFFCLLFWIANGLVYLVGLIITGEWLRLVPTSWTIFPHAWSSLVAYIHLRLAPPLPGQPFNALQKLAYFSIVCLLPPFQIATGLAMSPALAARFPWYIKLFGGRQAARSFHFLAMLVFIAFVIVHTFMVILHGYGTEVARIMWGRPEHRLLTIGLSIVTFIGIVLLHVAATKLSLDHPRAVQVALGKVVHAMTTLAFGWEGSREEHKRSQISPYFWVNGHPPVEESYRAMVRRGFKDWRLEVKGLVKDPLCLSLDDLRAMPKETQITKHNCIQGWSDIGAWGGVSMRRIIELCKPLPQARYVVFHAMDNKSTSERRAEGGGYFYGTLNMRLARHHQTILAHEFNGRPLSVPYGAPLRLRVETQLGFKMVKWLRSIEFIDDYRKIGRGMGGWREDYQYYDTQAGI